MMTEFSYVSHQIRKHKKRNKRVKIVSAKPAGLEQEIIFMKNYRALKISEVSAQKIFIESHKIKIPYSLSYSKGWERGDWERTIYW